jgi:manganese-dependent inorganic pyrophosphatase
MSVPPSLPLTRSAQPTYIIGHKNQEASGQTGFKPARCGNSNARIDAILGRFGAALPEFVGDVIPRIEDIMHRDPFKVGVDDTCARALELLDLHDVRALPVVGKDGRL